MMFNHLQNEFNEKKFSRFDRSRDDLEFLYLIDEINGMYHIKGYISMRELNGEYIISAYLDSNITEWNGWEVTANIKVSGFSDPNIEVFDNLTLHNKPTNGYITDPSRRIIGWAEVIIPKSNSFDINLHVFNNKHEFFKGNRIYNMFKFNLFR